MTDKSRKVFFDYLSAKLSPTWGDYGTTIIIDELWADAWQAATSAADAKYLLVIEKLVEEAIKKALDNYTLLNQIDAINEDSLPIVDALTPPWETDITKGQEEVDNIIECIMYKVRETLAATLLAGKKEEV